MKRKKEKESVEKREMKLLLESVLKFNDENSDLRKEFFDLMDWEEEKKDIDKTVALFVKYPDIPAQLFSLLKNHNEFNIDVFKKSDLNWKFWKYEEENIIRNPSFFIKFKEFFLDLPYISIPSDIKNAIEWGKNEDIDETKELIPDPDNAKRKLVRTIRPSKLKRHLLILFILSVVSTLVALLTTFILSFVSYSDLFFILVPLPWILFPASAFALLYIVSYVDRLELTYGWVIGFKNFNVSKGLRVFLVIFFLIIVILVSITPIGTILGVFNLFLGLLFWEGITFFTFAEKHYGTLDDPLQCYRDGGELMKEIKDLGKRARKVKDEIYWILLSTIIMVAIIYLFFWVFPTISFLNVFGFQTFSLNSFFSDFWSIMFPTNPTAGKQLQFMSVASLIIGIIFFTWKPLRTKKLAKIVLIYFVLVVIPLQSLFGLIGGPSLGTGTFGLIWNFLQSFFLITANLGTIIKAADINANSNQLKKSWLKFNFAIKNDEYYVVILFFMFMSGISGYFLSQLASGAFFPLVYNFKPFGFDWISLMNIFAYVGRNVIFIVGLIYMWMLYRQGLRFSDNKFVSFFLKLWKGYRKDEPDICDVWTPSFLKFDPVPNKPIEDLTSEN